LPSVFPWQVAEKLCVQAAQKDLRGEAREKSTSGGVLTKYVRLCEN
jgi:hypothetical protein